MVRYTLLGYPPVYFIALLGAMKLGLFLRLQAAWQQTFPEHVPREVDFSGYALSNTVYIFDLITGYLGADYPRELLMAPLRNVKTFIEDSVHYQLNGTAADSEWETLFPGNGLIVLGPHEQVFSISMFHQLRCLNMIRNVLVEHGGIRGHDGSSELVHHCVNYLRQMVLCRASMHRDDVVYLAVKGSQRIHSKHR